jgi:hypothetical protein
LKKIPAAEEPNKFHNHQKFAFSYPSPSVIHIAFVVCVYSCRPNSTLKPFGSIGTKGKQRCYFVGIWDRDISDPKLDSLSYSVVSLYFSFIFPLPFLNLFPARHKNFSTSIWICTVHNAPLTTILARPGISADPTRPLCCYLVYQTHDVIVILARALLSSV